MYKVYIHVYTCIYGPGAPNSFPRAPCTEMVTVDALQGLGRLPGGGGPGGRAAAAAADYDATSGRL